MGDSDLTLLDYFEDVSKAMFAFQEQGMTKIEQQEQRISSDAALIIQLQQQVQQLQQDLQEKTRELQDKVAEIEQLRQQLKQTREELQRLLTESQSWSEEKGRLLLREQALNGQLLSLQKESESKTQELQKEKETLDAQFQELEQRLLQTETRIQELQQTETDLKQRLAQEEEQRKELDQQLQALTSQNEELKIQLNQAKQQSQNLHKEIDKLAFLNVESKLRIYRTALFFNNQVLQSKNKLLIKPYPIYLVLLSVSGISVNVTDAQTQPWFVVSRKDSSSPLTGKKVVIKDETVEVQVTNFSIDEEKTTEDPEYCIFMDHEKCDLLDNSSLIREQLTSKRGDELRLRHVFLSNNTTSQPENSQRVSTVTELVQYFKERKFAQATQKISS